MSAGGTAGVEQRQDVGAAADVAEIALDTASQLHSTVARSADEDDVMTTVTTDVDLLHVAVLVHDQWRSYNALQQTVLMYSSVLVKDLSPVSTSRVDGPC